MALRALTILSIVSAGAALAQDYDIDWHTHDGGGETWSTGGAYELSGTIGQPDAGTMTGADFTLVGGLWAAPPCWCLSDVNNDGLRNGQDVQAFVECLLVTGPNCACADVQTDGIVDMYDVAAFVADLLDGESCP